ncbi:MAG: sensor histidine kinase [Acetobacteraceae bacterium]|nr:sensor histidine kinase [Acetobacteraceae bacterium]
MFLDLAPYAGLVIALVVCVALGARIGSLRRDLGRAQAMRDTAQGAEQTATRLLRLAASELRGIGMTLHGHADRLAAPPGTPAPGTPAPGTPAPGTPAGEASPAAPHPASHAMGLAAASAQILGLADELQDHTMPDIGTQSLREELVAPAEVMDAAVAATALALEPGRRQWRVVPAPGVFLWADRRALRHVLGRVLADAARNTRQDDAIDLLVQPHPEGLCLTIEDEGTGLASPEPGTAAPRDSRGIGLRLALARALMLSHGGRLEVEATAQVGTRVRLIFPATRLRDANAQPVAPELVAARG